MHFRKDPQKLFQEAMIKHQQQQQNHQVPSDDVLSQEEEKSSEEPQNNNHKRPYYVPSNKMDAWEQRYVYVKKHNAAHKSNVSPSKKGMQQHASMSDGGSTGHTTTTSTYTGDNNNNHEDNDDQDQVVGKSLDDRLFHNLAAKGMLLRMKEVVMQDPTVITKTDHNGWLALHEAARAGHTRVVNYLCELMDQNEINTRTNGGKGGTALWWAMHVFNEDHPTVKALIRHGAKRIGPNEK
jgi:ankyrin repeat protein